MLFGEVRSTKVPIKKKIIHIVEQQQKPVNNDVEGRVNFGSSFKKPSANNNAEDRAFGGLKWLGLNALINNGFSASTSTKTTYVTSYSTLTIGTVVTCFTKILFTSTTPCRRRKRKLLPGLMVGDDNIDAPISPSKTES